MFILIYIICSVVLGILMLFIYLNKYRGLSYNEWKPDAAWNRAMN